MMIHERQSAVSENCMLIHSLDKFTLSTVLSLYLHVEVPSYDEINGISLERLYTAYRLYSCSSIKAWFEEDIM